jgi:alpha-methylacyl-CoA racemase
MLLSDLGAEVLRVDRPDPGELSAHQDHRKDLLLRGRRSAAIDLKSPQGLEAALDLVAQADV